MPTHDAVLNALAAVGAAPHDILDVGCGTGRLLESAGRRWPEARLVGIDPSDAMIAQAERKHQGDARFLFKRSDASVLPLDSSSFDVAFTTMSFHHWTDQATAIREIARVLRPAGHFVLADPDMPFLRLVRPFLRWTDHVNLQDPEAIRQLLEQGGFSVVSFRRYWRVTRNQLFVARKQESA